MNLVIPPLFFYVVGAVLALSGVARALTLGRRRPERDIQGNVRTETLPFARPRAHDLYKALFGQVEDLIRDKHLLIVPSGPLTQLPFQVLVTARESIDGDYRATKWLARQNATTVLPAVSSLKALRRVARPSAATRPMLGVGNPLLDGNPVERPLEAKWAQLARDKQACPQTLWQRVAGLVEKRRSVQNHIGTVHAIALCNGLEAAMGALAEASIPSSKRWIPKGMDVSYTAKAVSDITCIAETDPEQWTGDDPDVPVRVRGVRDDGTTVVDGVIRLWVTEKPA